MTCSCAARRDAPADGSTRRAIIGWPWHLRCSAPFPGRTCGSLNGPRWPSATRGSSTTRRELGKRERGNGKREPPGHGHRWPRGVGEELPGSAGRPAARVGAALLAEVEADDAAHTAG